MTDAPAAAATLDSEARVDGSDLVGDVEFLVAKVRARGSATANEALRPLGLRVRQYAVLSLTCGSISPTQRDLADFLELDPSQIVAVVDKLQALGLVERAQDVRDRRVNILQATPKGRKVYVSARAAIAAAREESLSNLTPDERETLTRLLLKVAF